MIKDENKEKTNTRMMARIIFCDTCGGEHWHTEESIERVNPKYMYPVENGRVKCPLEGL